MQRACCDDIQITHAFSAEEERARERQFAPKQRPLEEILEEDMRVAEVYQEIRAEDDDVIVTGAGNDTIAVIE